MRWSQTHIITLKEAPADADILSQKLLVRSGMIRKLGPGLFTYGPLGLRAMRKFEAIVRRELDSRGCIEILMPMVQPQGLWQETHRWEKMGAGLQKFQNRQEQWFCLGATHEEVVTDYARQEIRSYRDLPKNFYQIQSKYRDEVRPRFGLMRGREFVMKDAYSFDLNREAALKAYQAMYDAYTAIFRSLGVEFRVVQADAGNIGGSQTHEFQLLAEAGEDSLLVSDRSEFAANIEVCPAIDPPEVVEEARRSAGLVTSSQQKEEFATPGLRTIEQLSAALKVPSSQLTKSLFLCPEASSKKTGSTDTIAVLLRGSDELNLIKLKNHLGWSSAPRFLSDAEVALLTGAKPGSCGPVGLQIPVYMDQGLREVKSMIVGANRDDWHLRNVMPGRDFAVTAVLDLRQAREGDVDPTHPDGRLRSFRGIELGHVFYLGTQYSQAMNATFLDQAGKSQFMEMGCYGIGVSRTIQALVEQCHDKDGIVWPAAVSPFSVHLCLLDPKDPVALQFAESLELGLQKNGIDFLTDDRDERPGSKFKDADLLGFPLRVNIGRRGLDEGALELVHRKTKQVEKIPKENLLSGILKAWAELQTR